MMGRIASSLVGCFLLAEVALAQVPEPAQPVREITNIQGGLYRVRDGRQHTVFVVTRDGIILVDPLSTATARWLKAELESRFPASPIRYVLATHHYYARAEGLGIFQAPPSSSHRLATTMRSIGHAAASTGIWPPWIATTTVRWTGKS
jgi:hypothetical protein